MALTLQAEQQMESADVITFFEKDQAIWKKVAIDTRKYIKQNYPTDAAVRQDDVAKALVNIIEVHEGFKAFKDEKKLRAKYWNRHLADLIIDRLWDDIVAGSEKPESNSQ
tara:strand:+ start:319 stop:648 length:330 start_codon:yes stop_codon:yes gene_type:complete